LSFALIPAVRVREQLVYDPLMRLLSPPLRVLALQVRKPDYFDGDRPRITHQLAWPHIDPPRRAIQELVDLSLAPLMLRHGLSF